MKLMSNITGEHQAQSEETLPEKKKRYQKKKSILYSVHVHVGLTFQISLPFNMLQLVKSLPF